MLVTGKVYPGSTKKEEENNKTEKKENGNRKPEEWENELDNATEEDLVELAGEFSL